MAVLRPKSQKHPYQIASGNSVLNCKYGKETNCWKTARVSLCISFLKTAWTFRVKGQVTVKYKIAELKKTHRNGIKINTSYIFSNKIYNVNMSFPTLIYFRKISFIAQNSQSYKSLSFQCKAKVAKPTLFQGCTILWINTLPVYLKSTNNGASCLAPGSPAL